MNTKALAELMQDLTASDIAVLERRARDLAHHTDASDEVIAVPVLSFRLAGETYAVRVEFVREVRPLQRLTRVPFAPDFITGVVNLRGNILSLVDVRKYLGIPEQQLTDLMVILVVECGGLETGILAQKVHEVMLLPTDNLLPPPATVNALDAEFIEGISPDGTILLNLERIFSDSRMIMNTNTF